MKVEPFLLSHYPSIHFFLNLANGVGFLGNVMLAILNASWYLPSNFGVFVQELLLARISGQPQSSHVISYVLIGMLGVFVAWREKDSFKGLLYAVSVAFAGESIWMGVYLYRFWGLVNWGAMVPIIISTVGLLVVSQLVLKVRYHISHSFWFASFPYIAYCLVWLILGLPLTVVNRLSLFAPVTFISTEWFNDPLVNLVEVASWGLIVACYAHVSWKSSQPKALSALYGNLFTTKKGMTS